MATVFLSGFSGVRDPGSDAPIVWGQLPVPFLLDAAGSDDVQDGSEIAAVQAALEAWGLPECTRFAFVFGGTTASAGVADDGRNLITFIERDWPGGADGAAAFTVRTTSGSPMVWTDVDIRVNGEAYSWGTRGEPERLDIQAILTHELGHALGLFHSGLPEATMYWRGARGLTHGRSLHEDDINGVCYLYPRSPPPACSRDEECPILLAQYGGSDLRTSCQQASCLAGPAPFGSDCWDGADCTTGWCARDPAGAPEWETGFCSQPCQDEPCPGGSFCAELEGQRLCAPGRDDCAEDQDCGAEGRSCRQDLDGRFRCLSSCVESSDCEGGEICHGFEGGVASGFCRRPGSKLAGERCEHALECLSLACTAGAARSTCASDGSEEVDGGSETPDAQQSSDGGSIADAEAEEPPPRAGRPKSADCGCAVFGTTDGLDALLFLGVLATVLRMRRG